MDWRRTAAWVGIALPLAGIAALAIVGARPTVEPAATAVAKPASGKPAPRIPLHPVPSPVEAPYIVKRVLDVASPMKFGEWHWDEAGAPATGEIVITVDLEAQVLSVFRNGYEIGTAVALYGADVKPTPLGVFKVSQRDADHVSNLYDAPMPYMLRLTNDGVSIHGSNVQAGYMTHGCVGVPTAFAKKLFAVTKLGTKVIVTRGEMLDVGGAITAA
jgi:lipoprotein-anchoring transpeptidase ErfK/SrfK